MMRQCSNYVLYILCVLFVQLNLARLHCTNFIDAFLLSVIVVEGNTESMCKSQRQREWEWQRRFSIRYCLLESNEKQNKATAVAQVAVASYYDALLASKIIWAEYNLRFVVDFYFIFVVVVHKFMVLMMMVMVFVLMLVFPFFGGVFLSALSHGCLDISVTFKHDIAWEWSHVYSMWCGKLLNHWLSLQNVYTIQWNICRYTYSLVGGRETITTFSNEFWRIEFLFIESPLWSIF